MTDGDGAERATVTITVTAGERRAGGADDAASTTDETPVSGNVSATTPTSTRHAATATLGASPANGTVTLAADGSFTYTPAANYNGTDSFTYKANDGDGGANARP